MQLGHSSLHYRYRTLEKPCLVQCIQSNNVLISKINLLIFLLNNSHIERQSR